jgi:Carboxypeptidase regulatory-like domain
VRSRTIPEVAVFLLIASGTLLSLATSCLGQTTSTGALAGEIIDPLGAPIPDATVRATHRRTNEIQSATSARDGTFVFTLLAPGDYDLEVSKDQYALLQQQNLHVRVTETLRLKLRLQLETLKQQLEVRSEDSMVQTDDSSLGRVVDENAVTNLPLVTRNFTQIAGLSPGVTTSVNNAAELGVGGAGFSQIAASNDGIFVHGQRSYDNNFEIDGVSVSDVQGSASASGGIPIPGPDTIQEFKVQTALYDASYGRYAGANISIVTQSGSNTYHGSAFEFLRNDVLNANDFFRNETGQPRAALKQNQFGFTFGGPIKTDRLLFFASYQGTRQVNGLAAGQARIACSATLSSPPLTNDRSPAALGALFEGMSGTNGGVSINSGGSNINPAALALLNFKLPNGSFLIPTPQTINPTKPFGSQGFSVISEPCPFNEDQFATDSDYLISSKSKLSARFFFANDEALITLPGGALIQVGNIPGFSSQDDSTFRVLSISHTYEFSNALLNVATLGYVRTNASTLPSSPLEWSDIGVTESDMNLNNALPALSISGSVSLTPSFPRTITQNSYVLSDDLSLIHGRHALRFGGSLTRVQDNLNIVGTGSFLQFLSWPDFLLGLSAFGNGTNFSNVFASVDSFGLLNREYMAWEGSAFAQDEFRVSKTVTLNLGLRYERLGQFADELGRNSSFDISQADANPPPEGTAAGYVVASNFTGQLLPGVIRSSSRFANNAEGQNGIAPRIGFAWTVFPDLGSLTLRGGYGEYFSRPTGQAYFQNVFSPPFAESRISRGLANAEASFQNPFAQPFPTPASFPRFPLYSPTTATTIDTSSPDFRPAIIQQYGLNIQAQVHPDFLLEIGYVGTRGTHLLRFRSLNQALSASPNDPIRGVTDNTLANIQSRVPVVGFAPASLLMVESEGESWFNALEASLTKRVSHGLQFLASYTFSKTLDTDGANINAISSGNTLTPGNQNDPNFRRGRASFDRTHRFVFSGTYSVPGIGTRVTKSISSGWLIAGVVTIQSGSALTITYVNSTNVFGITQDRPELAAGCDKAQLVTAGSMESKLNNYFNKACFATPPIIGADGIGTAFGNAGTGIVDGPGQFNVDFSLSKSIAVKWPQEDANLELRAESFNVFNHPQFANPDTNFNDATFGGIQSTAVNPRIIQLALRLRF